MAVRTGTALAYYDIIAGFTTLPAGDYTWMFTAKRITSSDIIISDANYTSNTTAFRVDPTGNLDWHIGSSIVRATNTNFTANQWYLIKATRSGSSLRLTLRNLETGEVTTGTGSDSSGASNFINDVRIGGRGGSTLNRFDGYFSFALFAKDIAISDADMEAIACGEPVMSFDWVPRLQWAVDFPHSGEKYPKEETGKARIERQSTTPFLLRGVEEIGPPSIRFHKRRKIFVPFDAGAVLVDIGQSQETDTAFGTTWAKNLAIPQASETDTGQIILLNRGLNLELSSETDTGFAFDETKSLEINQSQETDTASQFAIPASIEIIQASETDTGQIIDLLKELAIIQAIETDSGFAFDKTKSLEIDQSQETDTAFGTTGSKVTSIQLSEETDTAQDIKKYPL